MALTDLQRHILHHLGANRSSSSDVARGLALNADWPRLCDDIDIFDDTDEEIFASAERDLGVLEKAGFSNRIDIEVYGIVEATIGGLGARRRFSG